MSVSPEEFNRRSFVYRELVAAGATFAERDGAAVATTIPGGAEAPLQLADLSPLARTGVKGPRARAWLTQQGWSVPEANNTAARQASGALVLRLGDHELLLLADPGGDGGEIHALAGAIPGDGAWPLPRRDSHCWFVLRGAPTVDCLAKLCGVDLRAHAFAAGTIAQTSVARLNAIVCRDPAATVPAFHLLADSASAAWFRGALLDAMAEFGGMPAGLDDLA